MSRILFVLFLLLPVPALAQSVPNLMDFQGFLRTDGGQPVTKTVAMTLALYDVPSGGKPLYSEEIAAVPVYNGRFSVQIGATKLIPPGLFEMHPEVFLGLSVDGSPELPRQQLRTVPYAFRAGSSALADVATTAKELDCAGCVTTARLSDQSVTAAKLGEPCKEGQFLARVGGVWQCATIPVYSGKDFALSAQACNAGQKVQGISNDGTLVCGDDAWQAYTAGTGLVLESAKFSLDVSYADNRYVNAGEANAVTGPMIQNGVVTAAKLGEPCSAGEVLKMLPSGWGCAPDLDSPIIPGTGLKSAGNVLSVDSATIQGWAKDVCYDMPSELVAALATWDQVAQDDLTTSTVFGGDVSGKYDSLTIGTGKVTDAKIASVSWSKLIDIPAGFADGTDDGTTYTAGPGIAIVGTTISIPDSGVTNAMLRNPSLAVIAGSGLSGGGTVALGGSTTLQIAQKGVTNAMLADPSLTVAAGTGLTGGGTVALGGTTTLSLANTAVTPGTYKRATITVDAQGRLTAAANGPDIDLTTDVTGILAVANGGTGANTAIGARTNLGAAASGVNADITGLTRLSTQAAVVLLPYGTAADNEAEIRFLELAANGVNYVGFKAPDAIASNRIWTLPSADGSAGQVLATNGAGALSWATVGTGSVTEVKTGAGLTGGPITTSGTVSIATGGVTNAMLANPSITVTAGTGLTGGGIVSLGGATTLALSNTGVVPGSYTRASVTVDGQGRILSASSGGAIDLASSDVTGVLPPANGGSVWSVSGANIFRASGFVGIGKSTPTSALDVAGTVTATGASLSGTITLGGNVVSTGTFAIPSGQTLPGSAGTTGNLFLDTTTGTVYVSRNSAWQALGSGSGGGSYAPPESGLGSAGNPAVSCREIRDVRDGRTGLYWLKTTGGNSFKAWCEMEKNGGGWTLVLQASSASAYVYSHGVWTATSAPLSNVTDPRFDQDQVSPAFYDRPGEESMICLGDLSHCASWRHALGTARNLANGAAIASSADRTAWCGGPVCPADGLPLALASATLNMIAGTWHRFGYVNAVNAWGTRIRVGYSGDVDSSDSQDTVLGIGLECTASCVTGSTTPVGIAHGAGAGFYKVNWHPQPLSGALPAYLFVRAAKVSSTIGNSSAEPGRTCRTILAARPGVASGTYWITGDDSPGATPFQVYCDMDPAHDGGGWTLVLQTKSSASTYTRTAAVWTATSTSWSNVPDPAMDQDQVSPAFYIATATESMLCMGGLSSCASWDHEAKTARNLANGPEMGSSSGATATCNTFKCGAGDLPLALRSATGNPPYTGTWHRWGYVNFDSNDPSGWGGNMRVGFSGDTDGSDSGDTMIGLGLECVSSCLIRQSSSIGGSGYYYYSVPTKGAMKGFLFVR